MIRIPEYLEPPPSTAGPVRRGRPSRASEGVRLARPDRARLVQGLAHVASRSPRRWPRLAGTRPTRRRGPARSRSPTAARARSRRSRPPAAGVARRRTLATRSGGRSARRFLRRGDGGRGRDGDRVRAVAGAAGERDADRATTRAPGEVLRAALDAGSATSSLGIGGSATTDGGGGPAARRSALPRSRGRRPGRRRRRSPGSSRPAARAETRRVGRVATSPTRCSAERARRRPTARRRAPTPGEVAASTRALARYADASRRPPAGARSATTPGAGAAGGDGFGLLAIADRFASFDLRPGVEVVMERPASTRRSRTPTSCSPARAGSTPRPRSARPRSASPARAREAGVPCIAVGGGVTPKGSRRSPRVGAIAVPVIERPMTVEEAMAAGPAPLVARRARSRGCSSALIADESPAGGHRQARSRRPDEAQAQAPKKRQADPGDPSRLGEPARPLPAGLSTTRSTRCDDVRPAGLAARLRPDERADPHDPDPEQRRHERREGVRGAARPTRRERPADPSPGHRLGRRRPRGSVAARLGGGRVRAARRADRRHPAGRPRRRRRPGSRRRCATSARSAATTRSSSWARCRRSRPATG